MNILKVSNLFKLLVDASPVLESYHMGYAEDIERNVANAYDPNNQTGTRFPHLQWVLPVEGALSDSIDTINIALRFYALQDRNNEGEPITDTLGVQTEALKRAAVEFWMALRMKSIDGTKRGYGIAVSTTCKYFTDHYATSQRLICVGMDFDVKVGYSCEDYQSATLPIYVNLPENIPDNIELEYDL